jgi:superfamily I DNA/RNA helicase
MKFPSFTELDNDQRAIYSGAPLGDCILVMGPPGTGKTVMAFHRAERLSKLAKSKPDNSAVPRVIMYNKVLATYSSERDGVAPDVHCSTMHKWVYGWYLKAARRQPPFHPEDPFLHDWMQMLPELLVGLGRNPERVHWGHLIIDEGQDFPPAMYQTLSAINVGYEPVDSEYRPAVTVFADDNQRLRPTNSTVLQIQEALGINQGSVYTLRKNYRNSRQIAAFSRHFFVGLPSGVPDLPARVGQTLPCVVLASGLEVVRRRIAAFATNNPHMDIGVLCPREADRKRVYNSLATRLEASSMVVQTYSSATRETHPAEDLAFDKGGSVTVLNFQSSKGLEFDAVFIIDPFDGTAGASQQLTQMQMYVMTSRARNYLEILLMNPPANLAQLLPPKDLYEQVEE